MESLKMWAKSTVNGQRVPLALQAAVAAGVLLSSSPRRGPGREYVPVATLMVLIISVHTGMDAFSLGYAVQMGMGLLVGLTVNVRIFPPLKLEDSRAGFSRGRRVLIDQLEDVAAALVEQWPPFMRPGKAIEPIHVVC